MLIFYGAPASSAGKTHWLLEEIGVPYEYRRVDLRDPASVAAFRAVNPAGRVPFVIDGDVRLFESMAINFYLAERYQPDLVPANPTLRALAYQWSFWAITNLQPDAMTVMLEQFRPVEARDQATIAGGMGKVAKLMAELEAGLAGPFLLGERFSVADVNAGAVVNLALRAGAATAGPKAAAWMESLRARPAYQRAAKGG